MKKIASLILYIAISGTAFSQKPSKEQMEADKKKLAEAMKELDETTSKMDPVAKRHYDSMLNVFGMTQKMNGAIQQVNNSSTSQPAKIRRVAPAPTPSNAGMGSFIGLAGDKAAEAILPAAKNKAGEIYKALKEKGVAANTMGNAAVALWMDGRTQIALSLMSKACKDDANNIDNLNNYASMLHTMGAPELAIPRRIVHIEKIPLLGTGKKDYPQLARALETLLAQS